MEGGDDHVAGLGGGHGGVDGLRVAHFPDHDHVRILAERAAEGGGKTALAAGVDLPLGDHGLTVGIDEFDRVFQREDVLRHGAVDVVVYYGNYVIAEEGMTVSVIEIMEG